jgi:hypothetical protein
MQHDSGSGSDASAEPEHVRGLDEGEAHDRGLIVERLGWTPEQRLDANTAFLRFYLSVRPQGPLLRSE